VAGVKTRDFDSPDETRTPDKTQVAVVRMGVTTAARMTFEPGWRWSECVKPVAATESCQARHCGVAHSGRLAIKHEDGTEVEIGPGQAYVIEPGHDAWVVGDESGSSDSSSSRGRRRNTRRAKSWRRSRDHETEERPGCRWMRSRSRDLAERVTPPIASARRGRDPERRSHSCPCLGREMWSRDFSPSG
jgi:hypothetical protein